ncbi:MAG: hypothetical protein JNK79_09480 [Chitinophagaceae bacterium]|nr:hypothetical protein [Chitinophagaceae bacterium]
MKKLRGITLIVLAALAFFACKKEDNSISKAQLVEYMPLQPGKYIHYRLDSMRFIDFGQRDTIVSYDAKDVIDGELTDNIGRTTYRVIRYLRDISSTSEEDYIARLTYFVTPTGESIEVQEDNLKFQKLRLPVNEGFNWHGNTYLPAAPYYQLYQFSNDEDIQLWNYTYEFVDEPVTINDVTYDSTVTVLQVADSSNVPIEFPDGLAYRNYWSETYARNIGLVYKEVVMWEYQPPNSGNPGFRSGFGLTMSIIDHN